MSDKSTQRRPKKMLTMMKALESTMGNITASCEKAEISRKLHYKWVDQFPEYKEFVESIPDRVFDFVEGSLHKQIQSGNTTATIFWLKTKAKDKGYVERQEIVHGGGVSVQDLIQNIRELEHETEKENNGEDIRQG